MNLVYQNKVYLAAKEGHFEQLKNELENTPNRSRIVNSLTENCTPLIAAIKNGHTRIAKYLLEECDANVELKGTVQRDEEVIVGVTPLWCAASFKHLGLVKYLVRRQSADLNATTVYGSAPLRPACFDGEFPVVQYLLRNGADAQRVTAYGYSCLMIASWFGHQSVVEILLQYGADVNWRDKFGRTALEYAASNGQLETLKLLISKGAKVVRNNDSQTLVLKAASGGHHDVVKYLVSLESLASEMDVDIANTRNFTCLMGACHKGKLEMVKLLLECGANVKRKDSDGNSALHYCARNGNLDIFKLLLSRNSPMVKNCYGVTPLMEAALNAHLELVEYILLQADGLSFTRDERVDAIELLGAKLVKKEKYESAADCWRQAIRARQSEPNNPLPRHQISPKTVYVGVKEIENVEEVDVIQNNTFDMKIQAALVCERILGPAHLTTVCWMIQLGSTCADIGEYDRCRAFNFQALHNQLIQPVVSRELTAFTAVFQDLDEMWQWITAQYVEEIIVKELYMTLKIAVDNCFKINDVLKSQPARSIFLDSDQDDFYNLMNVVKHLISLVNRISLRFSKEELDQFICLIKQLVDADFRGKGRVTLLHWAVCLDKAGNYGIQHYPCVSTMDMLLSLGANVNACDENGDTPLHFAVRSAAIEITKRLTAHESDSEVTIIRRLIESGADVNIFNKSGYQPLKPLENEESVMKVLFPGGNPTRSSLNDGYVSSNCRIVTINNKIAANYNIHEMRTNWNKDDTRFIYSI